MRLLPRTAPGEERVALLLARAGALTATGQFAGSHQALLEGLALVPAESIALLARGCRWPLAAAPALARAMPKYPARACCPGVIITAGFNTDSQALERAASCHRDY